MFGALLPFPNNVNSFHYFENLRKYENLTFTSSKTDFFQNRLPKPSQQTLPKCLQGIPMTHNEEAPCDFKYAAAIKIYMYFV